MNLPGFNAETALSVRTTSTYRSSRHFLSQESKGDVTAQYSTGSGYKFLLPGHWMICDVWGCVVFGGGFTDM
jgi:hypothetical protein